MVAHKLPGAVGGVGPRLRNSQDELIKLHSLHGAVQPAGFIESGSSDKSQLELGSLQPDLFWDRGIFMDPVDELHQPVKIDLRVLG